jgi:hypothetical protein
LACGSLLSRQHPRRKPSSANTSGDNPR